MKILNRIIVILAFVVVNYFGLLCGVQLAVSQTQWMFVLGIVLLTSTVSFDCLLLARVVLRWAHKA